MMAENTLPTAEEDDGSAAPRPASAAVTRPVEHGGPRGPDPVRYGDWEKNGRCIDF